MKKRIDRYKYSKCLREIMLVIIAASCIGVIYKMSYIREKVAFIKTGIELYEQEEWIDAEVVLRESKEYKYFRYLEPKVEQLLKNLNWITVYHSEVKKTYEGLNQSKKEKDYELFCSKLLDYQRLGFEELEDYQKAYYLSKYPIETVIDDSWIQFKGFMQNILQYPMAYATYDWAKEHILDVPEAYFSSNKEEAIQNLFEVCDRQLYQDIIMQPYDLGKKLTSFNEIYEVNSQFGYQTQWLTPEITEYVRGEIATQALSADEEGLRMVRNHSKTSLRSVKETPVIVEEIEKFFSEAKKEMRLFAQSIQDYKNKASYFYYDSQIEQIEEDYIQQKENEIQDLIEAKYYDEAINWYTQLSNLKGFSQEIKDIEKVKYMKDPVLLIEDQLMDYTQYRVGEEALGGERYLVAINHQAMQCEVYPLIQEEERTSYRKFIFTLKDIVGSDSMYHLIQENEDIELMVNGDLIGLKTVTKDQEELVIFKVDENNAENLLYGFGVKIECDDLMKEITIYQSYDETEPVVAYYYDGSGYLKEENLTNEDWMGEGFVDRLPEDGMKQEPEEQDNFWQLDGLIYPSEGEERGKTPPLDIPEFVE